jgi:hypothetical protein
MLAATASAESAPQISESRVPTRSAALSRRSHPLPLLDYHVVVSKGFHCDWRDCDTWTFQKKRHGFLTIHGQGFGTLHFCSWDCVLKFSAQFEPTEEIGVGLDNE